MLLTAVLPVTCAAEPWQADCARLAESLITQDDTLTRNQQMEKSRAGDYLGREAWQREVPELLRQVAAGGDVSLRSPSGFGFAGRLYGGRCCSGTGAHRCRG